MRLRTFLLRCCWSCLCAAHSRSLRINHKRLIVVATMQLLPAAIVRWPVTGDRS